MNYPIINFLKLKQFYFWSPASLVTQMVKNLPAMQGDLSVIPGSGRSPREGNGNPLQCSCLENPLDRGAWRAAVHGVANSQTWQSNQTHTHTHTHTRTHLIACHWVWFANILFRIKTLFSLPLLGEIAQYPNIPLNVW